MVLRYVSAAPYEPIFGFRLNNFQPVIYFLTFRAAVHMPAFSAAGHMNPLSIL